LNESSHDFATLIETAGDSLVAHAEIQ